MLVVVHHRTVKRLDHSAFDLEAARCGDVFEVDRAEGRTQPDQGLDDLVGVLGVQDDRDRVKAAEGLEQRSLPSITGSEANGPISPRPSTALPSLTTATKRWAQVACRQRVVGSDGTAHLGNPGV